VSLYPDNNLNKITFELLEVKVIGKSSRSLQEEMKAQQLLSLEMATTMVENQT